MLKVSPVSDVNAPSRGVNHSPVCLNRGKIIPINLIIVRYHNEWVDSGLRSAYNKAKNLPRTQDAPL